MPEERDPRATCPICGASVLVRALDEEGAMLPPGEPGDSLRMTCMRAECDWSKVHSVRQVWKLSAIIEALSGWVGPKSSSSDDRP